MIGQTCRASLLWDDDAQVWYVSGMNFPGLVAKTFPVPALFAKLRRLVQGLFELNGRLLED